MCRQDLDKLLQNSSAPRAMMLYGESHFLIDSYIKKLHHDDNAATLLLYYDEYDYSLAKSHLSQGSLFGDSNILIIKSEKKVPKSDLLNLIALCMKNSMNYFIYAYYGTDYKKSATAAFSQKKETKHIVNEVRFFHPNVNESRSIILREAQTLNMKLSPSSASHLLLSQNSNLALAVNELPKLAILDRDITTKEIDDLVYSLAEVKLETFIEQILKKQEFKANLKNLLQHGEDEIRILTAISSFVTQLYLFHIYIKIHGTPSSLEIVGYNLPSFIEKERANLSIRYKEYQYSELLLLLTRVELELKSAKNIDKEAILISTLIKLQSIL